MSGVFFLMQETPHGKKEGLARQRGRAAPPAAKGRRRKCRGTVLLQRNLRTGGDFGSLPALMSSPSPTTPPTETGFDPLVFWFHHQAKILILVALFLVSMAGYGIFEWAHTHRLTASAQVFSSAKTGDDFRKIIADYPGTPAAGNARLLLANQLRNEGKFDESSSMLRDFIDKYPKHELISGAWTSLAANQEAQGKTDDALATFQKVSTSYPTSYSAPVALLAEARILTTKGKTDEARRIYEQIMTQYQDNVVAQQAAMENRRIKK
jgi:TolA-binding protein